MRILIVEDDRLSLAYIKEALSCYGTCTTATNGAEAIRSYIRAAQLGEPYDVVFMDIMLPEMNGLAAIDRIRDYELHNSLEVSRPSQVVVVTATDDSQNIIHAYCSGNVFAFLKKPLELAELQSVMAKISSSSETVL